MSVDLRFSLPRYLKSSVLCYTVIHSNDSNSSPDVAICSSNGYIYELKGKKLIHSLDIKGQMASSISAYYVYSGDKLVIYYMVLTITHTLLIIRRSDSCLEKTTFCNNVKEFEVFDFLELGYPQIKISFLNSLKTEIIHFLPAKPTCVCRSDKEHGVCVIANSLTDKLQMVNIHVDELTKEQNQIKLLCIENNAMVHENLDVVPLSALTFALYFFKKDVVSDTKFIGIWHKVIGNHWIFGIRMNQSNWNINKLIPFDVELVINQKKISKYTYFCFMSSELINEELFWPSDARSITKPEEQILVLGTFPVPQFDFESELSVTYSLTSSNYKKILMTKTFDLDVMDVVTASPESNFTIENLMAMIMTKTETTLIVESETDEKDLVESILGNRLGFKKLNYLKDQLFYCTSTYLSEVGVVLQRTAFNLPKCKLHLYTSNASEVYLLVNALYDLLPEKTSILCDMTHDSGVTTCGFD